jgi:murein DD-endopeptidase MepM/ murein hydrolase activator NlpD
VKKLAFILLLLVIVFVGALAVLSSSASLRLDPPVKAVGTGTPVKVHVEAPHGIRRVTAVLEQNGARYNIFESSNPPRRIVFFHSEAPRDFTFPAGKDRAPSIRDGKARLIVEAQSNDFLARTTTIATDVDVITTPPRVSVDGFQHYINQGGCELVTFTAAGYWTEAGVRVGKYTFRSFPLPGKSQNERFVLFAYPWDLPPDVVPVVYVRNPAGGEARGHFWYKVFPKKFRARDLPIENSFITKVVDQIDPNGSGDLLARFLKINGEMRKANNQTLADLRLKSEPRFHWQGAFVQLANSQVESKFADVRSYIYQGKKVDEQVHLGFDLAVRQHTPVVAANSGKVVWASDLGIYGNCIVVDHGFGLQSIYGHLSELAVKVGDTVKKGQEMGKSGSTGLAGGDHLHFTMQVDGTQVNPVEWWDEHWIHDRILSKVEPGS